MRGALNDRVGAIADGDDDQVYRYLVFRSFNRDRAPATGLLGFAEFHADQAHRL